jgi:hypothetical protein
MTTIAQAQRDEERVRGIIQDGLSEISAMLGHDWSGAYAEIDGRTEAEELIIRRLKEEGFLA